jgi:4-amino-4-deoxy-L-arabinose transferase
MSFLITYFSSFEILILIVAIFFHVISVYFFSIKHNTGYALILLLIGSLILRVLMINFDTFLHSWDEQYHALVAKHLSENPFLPTLYKEAILDYNPNNWTENYIWVHKQPLFLWQMALSIKIFGTTFFAVRLPSLLMSLILIPIIYRIGKLITNKEVGFIACLIYATNNYLLDFTTGYYHTDHNDVAFIFYVTLSIWVFVEYIYSNNKKYIYLIGLFAGLAILNKWLVGLLVFSGWGVSMFFIVGLKNKLKEFKNIGVAFLVCITTFIPWQIYVWINFKDNYVFEISKGAEHFFKVIEGHGGEWWYYLNQAKEQYGNLLVYLIPLALVLFYQKINNQKIKIAFTIYVLFVFSFFTFAKTKMPAFCLIISPIIFLAIGNLIFIIINYLEQKIKIAVSSFLILSIVIFFNIDIEKIQKNHTKQENGKEGWYRKEKIKGKKLAVQLKKEFQNEKIIVFNCDIEEYVQIMFFTNYLAYTKIPTKNEVMELQNKGYRIVVIKKFIELPPEIIQDINLIIFPDVDVF